MEVKDFGRSWRDGVAFNAIIHNIRPELVDMKQVPNNSNRANLEHAFSTAEQHLGIARLLDPEGDILLVRSLVASCQTQNLTLLPSNRDKCNDF